MNYSIQIHNRATGEIMNWTMNATSAGSNATSRMTFDHSTLHGEVVQRCEELVFTVHASSNIGHSEPGEVIGGFPIGNMHHSIGNMHHSTHFKCLTVLEISCS